MSKKKEEKALIKKESRAFVGKQHKKAKNIRWKETKSVVIHRLYKDGILACETKEVLPAESEYALQRAEEAAVAGEAMKLKAQAEPHKFGYVMRLVEGKDSVPIEWIGLAPDQNFRSENRDGSVDTEKYRSFPLAIVFDPNANPDQREKITADLEYNAPVGQAEIVMLESGQRVFLLPPHVPEQKQDSKKRSRKSKNQLPLFEA